MRQLQSSGVTTAALSGPPLANAVADGKPERKHDLGVMSELWNHYTAAVFRSKLPFITIPIPRGRAGQLAMCGLAVSNSAALPWNGLTVPT
jgi:hypothetical protein